MAARVKRARSGGRRLALGDRFGMDMHLGVAYSTRNTVIELEENRRIAWQTTASGPLGAVLGGRIWRYLLEPVEGGTLVTETWDLSQEKWTSKPVVKVTMAASTRRNMERTLARIEELVTGATSASGVLRPPADAPRRRRPSPSARRGCRACPAPPASAVSRPAGGQAQRPSRPARAGAATPPDGDQPVARVAPTHGSGGSSSRKRAASRASSVASSSGR